MPVTFEESNIEGCHLAIWQMTESLQDLEEVLNIIPEQESKLSDFKHERRKLEWICSRALIKHLIPGIKQVNVIYDIHGKPHLEGSDYHVSISHSGDYVAVIVSNEFAVAIDVETIRDRIFNIAKRFINEGEMKNLIEKHAMEQMHILWGAKEVMYKLYSTGDLSFHNELFVDQYKYEEKGDLKGYLLKENFAKSYSLHYEKINALMLVYGSESR